METLIDIDARNIELNILRSYRSNRRDYAECDCYFWHGFKRVFVSFETDFDKLNILRVKNANMSVYDKEIFIERLQIILY